jgi:hypothetical protein
MNIIDYLNALILFDARNFVVINELPFDLFSHFPNKTILQIQQITYILKNQ